MVQTTQLGMAMDGFLQAMAQAQANRQIREQNAVMQELNAARIANLNANTRATTAPLDAAQSLADAIAGAPADAAFSDLLRQNAGSFLQGEFNPQRLSVFTDDIDQRAALRLAGGGDIGVDDAFSIADRNAVDARGAAQSLAEAVAVQNAKPITVGEGDQVLLPESDPRRATFGDSVLGRDTFSTARGAIINDLAAGAPVEPLAAAAVLPQSGSINAAGLTEFGPTVLGENDPRNVGQLGKTQMGNIQTGLIALEEFKAGLQNFSSLIEQNPTSVGAVGRARGVVQDASAFAENVASAFGYNNLDEARARIAAQLPDQIARGAAFADQSGETFDAGVFDPLFDPSIPQIEQAGLLLAYQAAAALAAQTGRGLSDKDFQNFRRIIGDPLGLLNNSERLQAKLTDLDSRVDSLVDIRRAAAGLPPVQRDDTQQADYIFNPETGQLEPQ